MSVNATGSDMEGQGLREDEPGRQRWEEEEEEECQRREKEECHRREVRGGWLGRHQNLCQLFSGDLCERPVLTLTLNLES